MALFKIAKGVYVPNVWKLSEGFEVTPREGARLRIKANVSLENLDSFFRTATDCLIEPVFLILETPCNEVKERELRKNSEDPFHMDVYYSEPKSRADIIDLYARYDELLLNDGFVRFGVASQKTQDEVFVAAYKIVYLLGSAPNPFQNILNQFELPQIDQLVTAWDLFTDGDPGEKSRYKSPVGDIYDMIESLMRSGDIFFSKTVAD